MSGSHPCLDRAKRVLDCLSPDPHHLRRMIESRLHILKNSLVFPTSHATLRAGRAALLQRTLLAIRTPVFTDLQAALNGRESPNQSLPSRALIFVRLCVVNEVILPEAAISSGHLGHRLRDKHRYSSLVACEYLFTLVIATIRNSSDFVDAHLSTSKLGRRCQLIAINTIVSDDVRDD